MKSILNTIIIILFLGVSMSANSSEFIPENKLEETLIMAQTGKLELASLIEAFNTSQVSILINKEPPKSGVWDNSITPLILNNASGNPVLAIFTSPNRASKISQQNKTHKFLLQTDFSWVIKLINNTVGLVVNPGWQVGLEMAAQNVAQLKN